VDFLKSLVDDRVAKAREKLKLIPISAISTKDRAILEKGLALVLEDKGPEKERFGHLQDIEALIERRTPKEPKQPTYFEMLNSIIDWKLDGLRRDLNVPKVDRQMRQAEGWLISSCPILFRYLTPLVDAELVVQTPEGFNWKVRQTAVKMLLTRFGFNDWKGFARHCQINGKQVRENSLRNQTPAINRPPKDWERFLQIPTLRSFLK
jgi:hypothetical protein